MGKPAPFGVTAVFATPAGDLANYVVTGSFGAAGPGLPMQAFGAFNVALWASINTSLTTTKGSSSATVGSGTGLAVGASINSANVPPGTTILTLNNTAITLALPTMSFPGFSSAALSQITGLSTAYDLTKLVGATVTGPNIPANTTVTAASNTTGSVTLSAAPTASTNKTTPEFFEFALTSTAVVSGADTAALFTGAGVTWSGTVQIEKSFDGGSTWIVANTTVDGTLAVFSAGTPVTFAIDEPEKGVLYRANCPAYTSGTINYRLSASGGANMTFNR